MRIIREPLFHFLILGAAIFALYAVVTRHKTDKPRGNRGDAVLD